MTVITTMNLDDMNNSNQLNLDWITECLSGLSSLPTSETVEHDKRKNNLGRDNYYSKNNSLEIEEKTGDYFIKYFRHQLTDCLDSLYSINSYQLEALEIIYHLENPVEIFDYLHDKDDLVTFLLKAAKKINEFFADSVEMTLVKKSDPEIECNHYLTVYINTSDLSVAEAIAKFKKFKYEWYFEYSDNFDGEIVFHVT